MSSDAACKTTEEKLFLSLHLGLLIHTAEKGTCLISLLIQTSWALPTVLQQGTQEMFEISSTWTNEWVSSLLTYKLLF